jgi:hypothetical protein
MRRDGLSQRGLERSLGLKKWSLRGILEPDDKWKRPSVDRAKQFAEALGLEFYIGPERAGASDQGFAEAAVKFTPKKADACELAPSQPSGWAMPQRSIGLVVPATDSVENVSYVHPLGGATCRPGIPADAYLLIDNERPPLIEEPVVIEDIEGRMAVRQLVGKSETRIDVAGFYEDSDRWTRFSEQWDRPYVSSLNPIIAAFAEEPSVDKPQPNLLDDPFTRRDIAFSDPSGAEALQVKRGWLTKNGIRAEELFVRVVETDHMSPTLLVGDRILVLQRGSYPNGSILLVDIKGATKIRRFSLAGEAVALFWSDNPAHPEVDVLNQQETPYSIMGQVIWSSRWHLADSNSEEKEIT